MEIRGEEEGEEEERRERRRGKNGEKKKKGGREEEEEEAAPLPVIPASATGFNDWQRLCSFSGGVSS